MNPSLTIGSIYKVKFDSPYQYIHYIIISINHDIYTLENIQTHFVVQRSRSELLVHYEFIS